MPVLTITKGWADGETLDESELDAIKDGIETFVNDTKLDATNLQDGAVTGSKIADTAVSSSKIAASAVSTAKIADGAVTTDKLADSSVTTAKINDEAVTAAKIPDNGITGAKLESPITGSHTFSSQVNFSDKIGFGSSSQPELEKVSDRTVGVRRDGTSNVRSIVVSKNATTHGLAVLRGIYNVSTSSFTSGGEGVSVAKDATGVYTLTLETDFFNDIPAATFTALDSPTFGITAHNITMSTAITATSITIDITNVSSGAAADQNFSFIIVGERKN